MSIVWQPTAISQSICTTKI